ncbi:hypothetical protein Kpol_2000p84 [Vanderwaltozyma polyspora DSM 70294]|uniref:FHA domain-containing protein n=1 Tax=Vanderwaltozyma polyspora (strain ATCC 22028 / DSM 70294 / BCRC 21397 / CBS 2163 / NBRC 10782 / NRRL Y-8283 / UCD 57-17) TaxID=436907 RepID=A7TF91_VANPO|nr:uncharacterized protein Kpol_2000p84 [Vanderwaltozyma polyspora DSM 70294]EDO19116.1 hypothetical protein Kpol_2000p84 [Vanderwaltozyma polyspora DSM 70294]
MGRLSSPVRHSHSHENSNSSELEPSHSEKKFNVPPIHIELNPNDSTEQKIGRLSSECNIILPKLKNISRVHATLTYSKADNKIKLRCLGLNGLVVVFPRKLSCQLGRRDNVNPVYELSTDASQFNGHSEKEFIKHNDLSSFVLLKDETVYMPYIKNTIIDFRQVETFVTMKQLDYPEHEVASSNIELPSTPVRSFTEVNKEHPVISTPVRQQKRNELNRRKLESPSPIKKDSHHKHKQNKTQAIQKSESPEELIKNMNEKGINCIELGRVLANHLAFANVQQTPLSQLQSVNSKISTLSRSQVRALLHEEPCIGVIFRQGKDAAGKPLDEEYYYDLENDPDQERRNLVSSLKGGRTGLRSCRRTHKQYFWKKPAK